MIATLRQAKEIIRAWVDSYGQIPLRNMSPVDWKDLHESGQVVEMYLDHLEHLLEGRPPGRFSLVDIVDSYERGRHDEAL